MSKTTLCPQCHAQVRRRGRFCLECGCDLYEEGVRRPPLHIIPIAVLVLAFGGLLLYAVLSPPREKEDPDKAAVVSRTKALLRLAAEEEFREIVRRFYQPDVQRYQRTGELLREIVRGSGAPGLNLFRAACMDEPEEARKFVKKYEVAHAEYVAGLLGALAFQDGVLRTELGAKFGAQRTLDFVAWYLFLVFRPVDPAKAEVASAGWEYHPDGEDLYVVTLRFPADPAAVLPDPVPGVADPRRLVWRRLGEGEWSLLLGWEEAHFHLESVLELLLRVKP